MGLNWKQFELGVLRPNLEYLEETFNLPSPPAAVKLVGETLFHESNGLTCLGQVPNDDDPDGFGPGLGIGSIEQPTWDWMAVEYPKILGDHVYAQLVGDLPLNVWACRLRYRLAKPPLPDLTGGIPARALYWRMFYNGAKIDYRASYIAHAKLIPWVKP